MKFIRANNSHVEIVNYLINKSYSFLILIDINTLRTGDADLRFYITTVQDG